MDTGELGGDAWDVGGLEAFPGRRLLVAPVTLAMAIDGGGVAGRVLAHGFTRLAALDALPGVAAIEGGDGVFAHLDLSTGFYNE